MKRITKLQKKIADAHIKAFLAGNFDNPAINSVDELKRALINGKTFDWLYSGIETAYASVGSQLLASPKFFGHISNNYKTSLYKGFKRELTVLNII